MTTLGVTKAPEEEFIEAPDIMRIQRPGSSFNPG